MVHPQACTGANPPIQRQPTVSARGIIRHSILVCKGAFFVFDLCYFCKVEHTSHTVQTCPAQCFCFHPASQGLTSPGAPGSKTQWKGGVEMIQILAILIDLLSLVIIVAGIVLIVSFLRGWYASHPQHPGFHLPV